LPDDVDRVTDQQERILAATIAAQRPAGEGALTCDDCDDPIPELRRQAYPAARCCVRCQQAREVRR
jgi:phage/conjugal plasmid C-4 type zinc finger TraR family protein